MKKNKEWLKEELNKQIRTIDTARFVFTDSFRSGEATGKINGIYKALELVDQLEEPEQEKVVIPQFVADWLIYCKKLNMNILTSLMEVSNKEREKSNPELRIWFSSAQGSYKDKVELFARAWLDGYSVEKEKLYYVRENNYLLCKYKGEVIDYVEAIDRRITNSVKLKLTEKEIKDYDERFWTFAEEITK